MTNTESANPNTANLDKLSTQEFVNVFLQEDQAVWRALEKAKTEITAAIDLVYKNFIGIEETIEPYNPHEPKPYNGPKIFYLGAGTSGRLGVLDAVECLPTFSAHPEMIQGIIAGGERAITKAVEGAEDDAEAGKRIVEEKLNANDVLIGISASGGAAYVIAALEAARRLGAKTIAISNNPDALSFQYCDQRIFLDTGAEVLAGSTRLKAGTSQKITLNMISTGLMVKLGKVIGNLMVDVQATNIKLRKRAINLVMKITGCKEAEAIQALEKCQYGVKKAINIIRTDMKS